LCYSQRVVTSKDLAIKKGLYSQPSSNDLAVNYNPIKKITESDPVTDPKKNKKSKTTSNLKSILNLENDDEIYIDNDSNYLIEQIINNAVENIGVRYKSGGTTPDGFDCSGLLYATCKKFDITLPRSSFEMAKVGKVLDKNEYQVGDFIFFKTFGKRISHVGIITEVNDDEIKFVHSSTTLGVIISSTKEAYYNRTFAQVNRIL
jgi:lipoprotein Spr